jgi:hypothetical protein
MIRQLVQALAMAMALVLVPPSLSATEPCSEFPTEGHVMLEVDRDAVMVGNEALGVVVDNQLVLAQAVVATPSGLAAIVDVDQLAFGVEQGDVETVAYHPWKPCRVCNKGWVYLGRCSNGNCPRNANR